ncbi:GNAT family N-acetyltransferase [Methylosinus sp. Ce-a6]|uniref:GNAT family N-acetyltransferase n=1 Tax=Methylosinus sp. Ce-a6 TaxID=2172005 RepID=UPI0013573688|nr:GNAT family N-acetyltransferase [Methylosinus sp. Ce-a6]
MKARSNQSADQRSVGAPIATLISMTAVYERIEHLSVFYPNFESWFWDIVIPGIADGSRLVHPVMRDDRIVGVVIAKSATHEKKICTVWVEDPFKGRGLGVRLIRLGCNWLKTARPLATVPEERMSELSGILARLGFEQTGKVLSFYRPGKTEYIYNGLGNSFNS